MDDAPEGWTLAPFYEAQLDIAKSLGATHNFTWTCTLPQCILGSTRQCFMTLATQLGVYLFAHRLLGKPAVFPGSKLYWNAVTDATDAGLLAELNTWAALEPKCANQMLNAVNGDVFQWRFMWCVERAVCFIFQSKRALNRDHVHSRLGLQATTRCLLWLHRPSRRRNAHPHSRQGCRHHSLVCLTSRNPR